MMTPINFNEEASLVYKKFVHRIEDIGDMTQKGGVCIAIVMTATAVCVATSLIFSRPSVPLLQSILLISKASLYVGILTGTTLAVGLVPATGFTIGGYLINLLHIKVKFNINKKYSSETAQESF
jgi:hypothetical protein